MQRRICLYVYWLNNDILNEYGVKTVRIFNTVNDGNECIMGPSFVVITGYEIMDGSKDDELLQHKLIRRVLDFLIY